MSDEPIRLNLGAGGSDLPGFTPIDHKNGKEVYPLDCDDDSVDEIYASHILEHFSHQQVAQVLLHWVEKLKPGGRIRIAVPNFRWIAEKYLEGVPIPSQGYTMGGQIDDDDFHKCIFDRESLIEIMVNCGLERIGEWKSDIKDAAALDVSLNLVGYKPTVSARIPEGVFACLSCPRYGPMAHMQCANGVFAHLGISYMMGQGAYRSHILSELIERLLESDTCRFVLTCDYDTIFTENDVMELYRIMTALPEWDALVPMQQKRSDDAMLFGMLDENGEPRRGIWSSEFDKHVSRIASGHFGLTMFRADKLRALPRPWMIEKAAPDGRWGEGRVDPDIDFWTNWRKAGNTIGLANRVVVGHLQEVVTWPSRDLEPVYQYLKDFNDKGIPPEVRR